LLISLLVHAHRRAVRFTHTGTALVLYCRVRYSVRCKSELGAVGNEQGSEVIGSIVADGEMVRLICQPAKKSLLPHRA